MNCLLHGEAFAVFTRPRAAAASSRISRCASEKLLCRLLRHFPDAGMVAVSGIVPPVKTLTSKLYIKGYFTSRKTYPHFMNEKMWITWIKMIFRTDIRYQMWKNKIFSDKILYSQSYPHFHKIMISPFPPIHKLCITCG